MACENNLTDIALKLIKNNADLTVWDENFDTPLHIAFRKGNRTIAERIVDRARAKGHLKEVRLKPRSDMQRYTDVFFLDDDVKFNTIHISVLLFEVVIPYNKTNKKCFFIKLLEYLFSFFHVHHLSLTVSLTTSFSVLRLFI